MTAALLIVCASARADVAMPRDQWTPVRMVDERVKITVTSAKVTVEAAFTLKNEGEGATAVVGYPRGVMEESLDDFKVTVDGETAAVTSQEAAKTGIPRMRAATPKKPDGPVKREYQFEGPYPEWKVFNVPFEKDQQRKLVVTYSVKPATLDTEDHGKLLAYIYTMKTGATWKGNIDEAVVEMTLDGVSPADLVTVTPKKYEDKAGVLTWTFKDFKPTQDIEITFRAPEATAKAE
jgi:hypothetical protein